MESEWLKGTGTSCAETGAVLAHTTGTGAVATSPAYAQQLLSGGRLADIDSFRRALPGADGAVLVMFIDIDGMATAYPGLLDHDRTADMARDLGSLGLSARAEGDRGFSATLRLTAK